MNREGSAASPQVVSVCGRSAAVISEFGWCDVPSVFVVAAQLKALALKHQAPATNGGCSVSGNNDGSNGDNDGSHEISGNGASGRSRDAVSRHESPTASGQVSSRGVT